MPYRLRAVIFAAICASSAFGQGLITGSAGPGGSGGTTHFGPPLPFGIGAVAGAPYSAEQVMEVVQTLADGTHVVQKTTPTKMFRDSMGRTRTERSAMPGM